MKVAAFVPAKGTSDGLPGKNLRSLAGEPLVLRAIRTLSQCEAVDEFYIDSESDDVIDACQWVPGCKILWRDPSLATNETDGNQLMANAVEHVEADIYVQLLCTAPFVGPERITEAIEAAAKFGAATLVTRTQQYRWNDLGPLYPMDQIPNRGDLPVEQAETMGLYAITREAFLASRRRIGDRPKLIAVSPEEAIDINTQDDWELAEHVALGRLAVENRRLRALATYLTSEALTDTGRVQVVLPGSTPKSPAAVLGRAKTMHLRELKDGESADGIYKALDSYDSVVDNSVITIATDSPEYAYFGELNARIAQQRGASAAVVIGCTRDMRSTIDIGFPVFANGYEPVDCKGRVTVESIGRPLNKWIGWTIQPGDLIFADSGGVVVIPQEHEAEILSEAVEIVANEKALHRTLLDSTPQEAMKIHGRF